MSAASFKEYAVFSVISGVAHVAPFETIEQADMFMKHLGSPLDEHGEPTGEWHLYRRMD